MLASVLADRVAVLETLKDVAQLDSLALRNNMSEPIQFPVNPTTRQLTWFNSKCRVQGEESGGVLVPWNNSTMLFVGFQASLLTLSVDQSFAQIRNYRMKPQTVEATLDCLLSESRFKALGGAKSLKDPRKDAQGYWNFERECNLHYASSGLVYGWVPKA